MRAEATPSASWPVGVTSAASGDEREGGELDGEQDAAGERVAEHEDAADDAREVRGGRGRRR